MTFKKKLIQALPHVVAMAVFVLISIAFFYPQLEGYQIRQSDYSQYLGMSKEITDFRDEFDEEPLWTNSMFGGMPAYQISTSNPNIIGKARNLVLEVIPRPIGYMFFLFFGFYILLLCFKVDPWLSIVGSIAFGLVSFNILYMSTGHMTKIHAISFIPPIIGGIIYAFRQNALKGSLIVCVFLCLHLTANHLQMTYYSIFFISIIILFELFFSIKNKLLPKFIKASIILFIAVIIAILPTISNLFTTYEYGEYSTRGKSELTISSNNINENIDNNALDNEYIKRHNLGWGEIWSIAIPNIKGGAMGNMGREKEIIKSLNPQYREYIAKEQSYWGEQWGSGGAFYYGASVFLMFILGLFFYKNRIKWGILVITILSIALSWKFGFFIDFFIEYVPLFNKFRDTKMMLVLVQISLPLLGILFINHILKEKISTKKFLYVFGGVMALFLLFALLPKSFFDFLSSNESSSLSSQLSSNEITNSQINQIEDYYDELIKARVLIFQNDVYRSLGFTLITGLSILLFITKKIKKGLLFALLGIIIIIDLWNVDKRYFDNEKKGKEYTNWVETYKYYNPFQATTADNEILKNEILNSPEIKNKVESAVNSLIINSKKTSYESQVEKEKEAFRILNLNTNYRVLSLLSPFSNARTSYYHKSIGGYHGAKLKNYQELIEFQIGNEYSKIIDRLNKQATTNDINNLLINETPILNMLNTKYIIYNTSAAPIVNYFYYGNAWFVNEIIFVKDANEEILAIGDLKNNKAVIQEKFKDRISIDFVDDSSSFINLVDYKPNHLIYSSSTNNPQLAIFSEIYYEKGWNAYLDGKQTDYFKANYLLRAMIIPEGEHKIEFIFEPQSYKIGRTISNIGSVLFLIFIVSGLFFNNKKRILKYILERHQ